MTFLPIPPISYTASSNRRACIEADGIVPEELALPLRVHHPVQYERDGLWKVGFAMRIVRRIHQDMIADQVDDGVGQLGTFRDLDALEIPPASNVLARRVTKFRERGFDRL